MVLGSPRELHSYSGACMKRWPNTNVGWSRYYYGLWSAKGTLASEQLMWLHLIFAALHDELDAE